MSPLSRDLTRLEAALLTDPSVYDCAVRLRPQRGNGAKAVAYVVPAPGFTEESANTRLRSDVEPGSLA